MNEPSSVKPLIGESSTSESTNVEVVLNDLRDGAVLIPDYQRDSDQWSRQTKSLLIESVINNLPIPAFFFEVDKDKNDVEINYVVDGQQRITTINEFFQHKLRLVDSQDAPYISPNSIHYAGKTFDELPEIYQRAFKKYRLSIIKLRDLKDMRLEVFRRINLGGTPLSGQDIRLAYYGENSPSLTFIRLVGIYDGASQASKRFLDKATENFKLSFPWDEGIAYNNWKDMWDQKAISRGQTASEMFLWSLMSSQHSQLDSILQNKDVLSTLKVRFDGGINAALDVYSAQMQYQDLNANTPTALLGFEQVRTKFFAYFKSWIEKLGISGPSISVTKHRTIASIIGAGFRNDLKMESITEEQWGLIIEFIRSPTRSEEMLGITWPQSRGRWIGEKGHYAQLRTASEIVQKITS